MSIRGADQKQEQRQSKKPEWVQATCFAIATVVGLGTFYVKEIHLPQQAPATLTVQPSLEVIGRQGNNFLIRAAFVVENRSSRRVHVPVGWYNVYGHCFGARDISVASFANMTQDSLPRAANRFSPHSDGEVVARGPVFSKVHTFDPDSERRLEQLFLVPADRFNALQMNLDYFLTRTEDRLEKLPRWKILENGALHGQPLIASARGTPKSEPYSKKKHKSWGKRAGAAWGFSHASVSLWPAEGSERGAASESADRCTSTAPSSAPSAPASAASAQIAIRR